MTTELPPGVTLGKNRSGKLSTSEWPQQEAELPEPTSTSGIADLESAGTTRKAGAPSARGRRER